MPKEQKKKPTFESQFTIVDRESCAKAIRNGGIVALITAGLSSIFAIAGFFTSSTDQRLSYLLDPWILLDVALVVVLAVFIFRKSRVAATLLFVYFLGSKLLQMTQTGLPNVVSLAITLLFLAYYFTAMRATYIWRSKYRDAAPAASAT